MVASSNKNKAAAKAADKSAAKAADKSAKAVKPAKPVKVAKVAKAEKPVAKPVVKPAGSAPRLADARNIDIGISARDREKIAAGLAKVLADSYSLYLKTHNFHWNVVGPMFNTLHQMFETQYDELALAVDQIAERIRALGYPAPGSYSEFSRLTAIPDTVGVPTAENMIALLVSGNETVVRTARALFPAVEAASDETTADLLTQRMQAHEKAAWMLRSLLQG